MPSLPAHRAAFVLLFSVVNLAASPRPALAQLRPKARPSASPGAPPGRAPAASAAPRPLSETLNDDAKEAYESGRLLFGVGNFEGALVKFQQAYELSGDPRLLWNVAACEKGLAHYARLITLLEAYRASPSALITEADRAEAAKIVGRTASFVGALRVDVSEEGARVFVDGRAVGTTPLAGPLRVDVGEREVRVAKAGFREVRSTQAVPGGEPVALQVRLEPDVHRGKLALEAGPTDRIEIDGRAAGVWRWEGTVASGAHRVGVSAPGKKAYDAEVVVHDDETRRVRVVLEAERSGGGGVWPWVVGGVLAAGGLALGGYLVL